MTEHFGHEKNQAEPGRASTNVRNGSRGKTVSSDAAGEVRIDVPRDRKCLYLVTHSLDPIGAGRAERTMRWKPMLNAFAINFGDRWPAAETY